MAEPPGIRIVRVFAASSERVWAEWTEPERFADWFGGADGEVPVSSVSMDVRPGGAWRLTMFAGRAGRIREIRWAGEYLEVQPPSRLRFTVTDRPEGTCSSWSRSPCRSSTRTGPRWSSSSGAT